MTCEPSEVITSSDLSGLKSDILTIDSVVESSLDTTTTKSGKVINTLEGQLKLLGFEPPVTYAGSIVFTTNDNTKTVDEAGVVYAPLPSALPFTTSGTFIGDDDARFFVVQGVTTDQLINDLSQAYAFDTVAAMTASSIIFTLTKKLSTKGKITVNDGLGADYIVTATQPLTEGDETLNDGKIAVIKGQAFKSVRVGSGTVTPQPNAAFQSVRDHTVDNGFSIHGCIIADLFTIDTSAMNCFGSDVEVGDGSHAAPFLIDHVNSFQSRNIIELGLGGMTSHGVLITFDELRSGIVARHTGALFVDLLGQNDTPGLNIPNFEVNGAAQVNNQTGITTQIKHGLNPRSAHFSAGVNDADAAITTGGAIVDCEAPVVIRQVTPSTSKATGALLLTDGGIGCNGAIHAADDINVNGATASFTLRSAAGTLLGRTTHNATNMDVINDFSGTLRLGVSTSAILELLSDRFRPIVDGVPFLGDGSHRWNTVFSITGTINTSDENEKNIIGGIDDRLLDAWENVEHFLFNWKDAVEAKGRAARIHAGHIAQQVQKSLTDAGFDGFRYGLLCEDELTEEVTKTRPSKRPVMTTIKGEREEFIENDKGRLIRTMVPYSDSVPLTKEATVFNKDGTPYLVDTFDVVRVNVGTEEKPEYENREKLVKRPLVKTVVVMEDYEEEYTETIKTGAKRMGLRYDQCMIIEAAYLRREIARFKKSKAL